MIRKCLILLTLGWSLLPLLLAASGEHPSSEEEPRHLALESNFVQMSEGQLVLHLPDGPQKFQINAQSTHPDGSSSIRGASHDGLWSGVITVGDSAVFGMLHTPAGDRLLTTNAEGSWVIDLPAGGASFNLCGTEHPGKRPARPQQVVGVESDAATVIDLLLIYNDAFDQRYPGALLQTRMAHLVHLANESMGNSGLDVGFRLVGTTRYPYRNDNSNLDFRNDIAATLGGNQRPGLEGLASERDNLGADLVIGLRPHDIEARGSCGIAFFPDGNAALGANVVSDGISSWSVCLDDVLTHEIGHNLGATHQLDTNGGGVDPRGSAFTRDGRFSTVMASFGTGRPDRFRGLLMFSNPDLACGNEPCGNRTDTNNVIVMRDFVTSVANYRTARSDLPAPDSPERTASDSDGDGFVDWVDALPFDASESLDSDLDGTGDNRDAFPLDPLEQRDTDGDGVGDLADTDDDNDGVVDTDDGFPLDPTETGDQDRDGVGDNRDALPLNRRDYQDSDLDLIGDNEDPDDDNDGTPDFSTTEQDVLVISAGNGQILRFDSATGDPRGVEVPPWDSLITFQSSMVYRQSDQTLVFSGNSGLRRLDLRSRQSLGEWVPPYAADPDEVALNSGFPTAMTSTEGGDRLVIATLGDPALRTFRGLEQARSEAFINWTLDLEDIPGALAAEGDVAYVLGTRLDTIYRVTGLGVTFLAGPGVDWLGTPEHMAVSGDGRLLISDSSRNGVIAVDQETGAFLGELLTLTGTGHSQPRGIAVTAAGELLLATAVPAAILAFDPESGEYLGERVPAGRDGLADPEQLVVVPALLDRFATNPQRQFRPNPGLWFDPVSSGRGFDIQYYGTRLSVIWYTYDQAGLPTWYLASGELEAQQYDAPLNRFTLNQNGELLGEIVGSVALDFASERRASVTWQVDGIAGTESLEWIRFTPFAAQEDVTGLWGRDDGPGWGISLANQGDQAVAVAYIYDDQGNPRWVISEPVIGPPPYELNMLSSEAPGLCPGCDGSGGNTLTPAGTMSLSVTEPGSWTSEVRFPAPLSGDWILEGTPIRLFSEPSIRPR